MDAFILSFFPLFVAVDAIGTLPIIITLSEQMTPRERRRAVHVAIFTASVIGLVFLFAGRYALKLLDISVGHFAIAGGLVLVGLSLRDLVMGKMAEMPSKEEMVAIVPIGTPLTVGPATLTTLLFLTDEHQLWIVLAAFAANMIAAWLIFLQANRVVAFLGQGGLKATSKVAALILAAIAVKMIVKGLTLVFPGLA